MPDEHGVPTVPELLLNIAAKIRRIEALEAAVEDIAYLIEDDHGEVTDMNLHAIRDVAVAARTAGLDEEVAGS